jgi:hypothetical protein
MLADNVCKKTLADMFGTPIGSDCYNRPGLTDAVLALTP